MKDLYILDATGYVYRSYFAIGQDLTFALGAAIGGQEGAFKSMVSTMLSGIDKIISALLAQAVAAYIATKAAIPGGLIAAAVVMPAIIVIQAWKTSVTMLFIPVTSVMAVSQST